MQSIKLKAISGSLRAASTNTALLRALAARAPSDLQVSLFEGIGELPFFSPEKDADDEPHPTVARLSRALATADAVVISTPEYAHGIPGSLKNALDWVVGSGELSQKPVAVISTSPSEDGGSHAHASLIEVLATMDARVIPAASPAIGFGRAKLGGGDDPAAITPELKAQLTACLAALREAVIAARR